MPSIKTNIEKGLIDFTLMMLTFYVEQYIITIADAHSLSQDALSQFYAVYSDFKPTSTQVISLFKGQQLLIKVLVGASGGGTGVYANTAVLNGDRVVTCCSDSVFCLSATSLELLWKTKADWATCFAIYTYQQDYIVHGEAEISRLDRQGNIVWQNSGADIFVTPHGNSNLVLLEDSIVATDFEFSKYTFDYNGNTISYTRANSRSHPCVL